VICPICKVAQLEIKKGYYFCPAQKIYISKVGSEGVQPLTAAAPPVIQNPKIVDRWGIFKSYLIKSAVMVVVISIYLVITNLSSYIDVSPFCHVKVESNDLKGNRSTIFEAIKYLKKQDLSSYKILCQNVSKISEEICLVYSGSLESAAPGIPLSVTPDGCYVKGTKNIYLTPSRESSSDVIAARAQAIKKYAVFSQAFWQNKR